MKFGAVMSIVATTAAIWGLSGPACQPKSKDTFAPEGVADQITAHSVQNRTGREVGTSDTAKVIVSDEGILRRNTEVTFAVTRAEDGAHVSAAKVMTDNTGVASVLWTYGQKPGEYKLIVKVTENPNLELPFVTQVVAGALSKLVVPATGTVDVNATLQLAATTADRYDNPVNGTVTWRSLNPATATVDNTGLVAGVSGGTARIVAAAGTLEDTTVVTVRAVVTGIDIGAPSLTLNAGSTMQLTANVFGNPTAAVTWSSLNQTVATVDGTGMLTAVAAGEARVVAQAGTKADTATFTVTAAPQTTVNVSPGSQMSLKRLAAGTTESFQGLYVGDHEANGDKGMQAFVMYSLQTVPPGATIASAKFTLLVSANSAEGNPASLGPLFAERTTLPELNEGALSTSAIEIGAAQQMTTVDITPLVRQAHAAGETTVWLRLRFRDVQNNNGVTDYGAFMAGGLEIKY